MVCALLATMFTVSSHVGAASYSVIFSTSAARTAPAPLGGATVRGSIYAFTVPTSGVSSVEFYLDDASMTREPRRVEVIAPFDFAGGSTSTATSFNTAEIADGNHSITAKVTGTAGTEVTSATFTVANSPPAPPSSSPNTSASSSPAPAFALYYSIWPDRSAAKALHGSTVAGNIYVFTTPATNTTRVRFYLDDPTMAGVPRRTEMVKPWDLAGGTSSVADPLDTRALADGTHTITTSIDTSTGTTVVLTSTWTLRNAVTSPSPTPSTTPGTPPQPVSFAWRDEAPKSQRAYESNGLAAGGKLYVFGGFVDTALRATNISEAFDPATNSWTTLTPLPQALTHSAAVLDGNSIWLLGGYVGNHPGPSTTAVFKYNITTNTWSSGPSLPQDRSGGGAALVGRTLHFFGGAKRAGGATETTDQGDHWTLSLDTPGAVWTSVASMPNPRNHLGAAAVGTKIYVIGGQYTHNEGTTSQVQVDVYDTLAKSWSRARNLPLGRSHITPSVVVHRGKILTFGGTRDDGKFGTAMTESSVYDPATDTWVAFPPLPATRKAPVAGIIDGRVYVATGNAGGTVATATNWSAALDGVWDVAPASPVALGEVAGGIIGNTMYLVGEGNSATLAFDLSARSWKPTANQAVRPHVGHHAAAEVVGGKLYLFGGLGAGAGKVQIYNPVADSWSTGADMPFAAGSSSSAVIGGNVYVTGGIIGSTTTAQAAVYHPATNSWQSIAPMKQGRNHAAGGTDGARLYVLGGRGAGSGDSNMVSNGFDTLQIYNPVTNVWESSLDSGSTLRPLPVPRGGTGRSAYNGGEFYVMGGETKTGAGAVTGNVYNRVDVYNPVSNSWRMSSSMVTARHGIFPLALNGRIYAALGGVQAGASTSSVNEIYLAG